MFEEKDEYLKELLEDVKEIRHELGFIATMEESASITSMAVQIAIELREQARHDEMSYWDFS